MPVGSTSSPGHDVLARAADVHARLGARSMRTARDAAVGPLERDDASAPGGIGAPVMMRAQKPVLTA